MHQALSSFPTRRSSDLGTLALIVQHRAVGHAIPGIVAGHLYQYPHLGDGSTTTDNRVYNPALDPDADKRSVGAMYNPSTVAPGPNERVMATDGETSGRLRSEEHTSELQSR